jgi:DNA (cytosine-5)-methyltransferase 1
VLDGWAMREGSLDRVALRSIELFAGGGGLALGLERVGARAVCFVEREAFAAATLVRQMDEGRLAPCPVWTDVCTFDGRPWRGVVDLIAGGFPCQDVSSAGKGAGVADGRKSGLWREYARIVGEVRPRFVFVENVSALTFRGLDIVLGDLAALGFDAEWGCLGADDAGAPHQRDRIFVLAHASGHGRPRRRDELRGSVPLGRGAAWPPGPDDAEGWRAYLDRWPDRQPGVRRSVDGVAREVDRLRLLGNGVVPAQAELAFRVLWGRLMETER